MIQFFRRPVYNQQSFFVTSQLDLQTNRCVRTHGAPMNNDSHQAFCQKNLIFINVYYIFDFYPFELTHLLAR